MSCCPCSYTTAAKTHSSTSGCPSGASSHNWQLYCTQTEWSTCVFFASYQHRLLQKLLHSLFPSPSFWILMFNSWGFPPLQKPSAGNILKSKAPTSDSTIPKINRYRVRKYYCGSTHGKTKISPTLPYFTCTYVPYICRQGEKKRLLPSWKCREWQHHSKQRYSKFNPKKCDWSQEGLEGCNSA